MSERAKRADVPMMLETHRGRVTQDLVRTVGYATAIPDLRFCLDISHYVVAGELGGRLSPEADAALDALLRRAPMVDGRVSNGEQVQVAVDPASEDTKKFLALWKRAMVYWLKGARRGEQFVFRVELGPPGYGIVAPGGRELSDRWEEAKVLRGLAERIWNEAVAETGVGSPHGSERRPVAPPALQTSLAPRRPRLPGAEWVNPPARSPGPTARGRRASRGRRTSS